MGELNCLVDKEAENNTANYWIDQTHNVFAFIRKNSKGEEMICVFNFSPLLAILTLIVLPSLSKS